MSARHKLFVASKPLEEALELLRDDYGADADSATAFVRWVKDERDDKPPPGPVIERRHKVADLEAGVEREIETEPGSIPPRPVRRQSPRR